MSQKKPVDLSIIITAHAEGILAHKTLLSIFRNLEELDKNSITYEIIVHIDNGDVATLAYYERYADDPRFTIYKNSFGNPADSRNFAVKKATGTYSALLDGDDMVSRRWLSEGVKLLQDRDSEQLILRPQYHFHFGIAEELNDAWIMEGSFTKEEDALLLSFYNRWTLTLITKTDILRNTPFKPALNGYAYEDWLFNADIRHKDVLVDIVPGATFFYRRRLNSVTSQHTGGILEYSELFDIDFIKSINLPNEVIGKQSTKLNNWKSTGKMLTIELAKTLRKSNRIRVLSDPLIQGSLYNKRASQMPLPLMEAWRDINSIEHQLYPTKSSVRSVNFHPLSFNQKDFRFGYVYKKLADQVTALPDYIFLPPKLGVGGTEKLLFNYIDAILEIHPAWHIAVIGKPVGHFADRYKKRVDFIDFDSATHGMEQYQKEIIWSRLLIQLKCKRLHLINNEWFYDWMRHHQGILSEFTINVSMFMREYSTEPGRIRSYADPQLVDIYPVVSSIFTDNENIVTEMLSNNAFDPAKIKVHYQPVDTENMISPKKIESGRPLRVIWAGRLAPQKRPDILKKIGELADSSKLHIDVYGSGPKYNGHEFFKGVKSITYKGPFSGIDSLPTEDYDVFLYTSSVDGLPNILLEVATKGLPVVASDDGGVKELIQHNKTGYLVDIEDVDGYINALYEIVDSPDKATNLASHLQELTLSRHTQKHFVDTLRDNI
jgi:glycosyltransferase involved in cell wall biosynthesis